MSLAYTGPRKVISVPQTKMYEAFEVEIRAWNEFDWAHVTSWGYDRERIQPLLVTHRNGPGGGEFQMFLYNGGLQSQGSKAGSHDNYAGNWIIGIAWLLTIAPDKHWPDRAWFVHRGYTAEHFVAQFLGILPEEWWTFSLVHELEIVPGSQDE